MDKIIITNMKFFAFHGVYPEEQENGQDFLIDAELGLDLRKAGVSDELADTVDYSEVYAIIKSITKGNRFKLIEKLADEICRRLFARYDAVGNVDIRIRKPDALTSCEIGWVGICISRSRADFEAR